MSEENVQATPFNMAMLYYMELHKLRMKKTECALMGQMNLVYECLEEMFTIVSFKLTKNEKEDIQKEMDKAYTHIANSLNAEINNALGGLPVLQANKILREVERKILTKMDKYSMIFPKIDLPNGMEKITARYGL